jgi:hypothetical protein
MTALDNGLVLDNATGHAMLTVHAIRTRVAEYNAMEEATYLAHRREEAIRRLCERNECDLLARRILNILDGK